MSNRTKKRAGLKLTRAMKARICREVALGKSLRKVLKAKGMPSMSRVMEVLGNDTDWEEQYARARQRGIELHIDGIVDLADTATAENAQAVRLKVDTRKWIASKILPKLYGDRVSVDLPPEMPDYEDMRDTAKRLAFMLYTADKKNAEEAKAAETPAPARARLPAPPPTPVYREVDRRLQREEKEINPGPTFVPSREEPGR